ncbi:MAG: iron-sulfur cluster co-chaperone HscB C-terminal domain-containing protein, partial [Chitinophagales bacterium]
AVLTDMDKRMRYILMEAGYLKEEEKFILPQDFLMEMMDINEKLMEVQMDADKDASAAIKNEITQLEESLYQDILPTLQNFDINSLTPDIMLSIKTYYFKRKYLLRLLEQVDGGGE